MFTFLFICVVVVIIAMIANHSSATFYDVNPPRDRDDEAK